MSENEKRPASLSLPAAALFQGIQDTFDSVTICLAPRIEKRGLCAVNGNQKPTVFAFDFNLQQEVV
jgi:hypothetical protein